VTGAGAAQIGESLLTLAHLSDLHLCDSQSPARAEFLDRWADPNSPVKAEVDAVGSYRAQDCLTVQVGEAIVRAVNAVAAGPIGGAPIDWALTTGDVTDNAQANEVGWYLGPIPAIGPFAAAGDAALKAIGVPPHWSHQAIAQFCHDVDQCEIDALALWSTLVTRPITADPARRTVTRPEFIAGALRTVRPSARARLSRRGSAIWCRLLPSRSRPNHAADPGHGERARRLARLARRPAVRLAGVRAGLGR
jgi:hypothetical protein